MTQHRHNQTDATRHDTDKQRKADQGKTDKLRDEPVIPGGRKPDTAMCEDRDKPGIVDKAEDC